MPWVSLNYSSPVLSRCLTAALIVFWLSVLGSDHHIDHRKSRNDGYPAENEALMHRRDNLSGGLPDVNAEEQRAERYAIFIFKNTSLQYTLRGKPLSEMVDEIKSPTLPELEDPDKDTTAEGVNIILTYTVQDVNALDLSVPAAAITRKPPAFDIAPGYDILISWLASPKVAVLVKHPLLHAQWNESQDLAYCGPIYDAFLAGAWYASGSPSEIKDPWRQAYTAATMLYTLSRNYAEIRDRLRVLGRWPPSGSPVPLQVKCDINLVNVGNLRRKDNTYDCQQDYIESIPAIGALPAEISSPDWASLTTTENLALITIGGGADSKGVWWFGKKPESSLSRYLGQTLLGIDNFECSLESKCKISLDCRLIGPRKAVGLGYSGEILPSGWGYLVLKSLMNINDQLYNHYSGIKDAGIRAILDNFNIDKFYPNRDQQFDIRNALLGLGTGLAIAGGFAPKLGPVLGPGSAILPAIGGFMGNRIAELSNPIVAQQTFAPRLEEIYNDYVFALNNATTTLFQGDQIRGKDISTMMGNGSWVRTSTLTPVSIIQEQLKAEILSRSIDALWKTPPVDKLWVLFVDLKDVEGSTANCALDMQGWRNFSYCGDGGIYYAYRYVEGGHLTGHVDYPYGTTSLADFDLDMKWVVEASAKTYRLAQNASYNLDPFNFSAQSTTEAFLLDIAAKEAPAEVADAAGHYPGSWTLPVCDTSTWGGRWNYDLMNRPNDVPKFTEYITATSFIVSTGSPPCICGVGGKETARWAVAARLKDFETYYHFCKKQLEDKDFEWPEGIDCVNYGFRAPMEKPIKKPGAQDC